MIDLTASAPGLALMVDAAGRAGNHARQAATAALRKLRTHVLAVTKREAAREADVPQRTVATRWISDQPGPNGLRVWVGASPVPLEKLGTPRQTRTGVRVGRRNLPGAFLATMPSGHKGIYIRRSSSRFDPTLYKTPRSNPARPYSRLPVAKALGVPLMEPVERSFAGKAREFEEFFRRHFFAQLQSRMGR